MDFFDKLGEAAKNVSSNVNTSMEISRLNREISDEHDNITVYKAELGEFYWNAYSQGAHVLPEGEDICAKIKASLAKIEELDGEIQRIREEKEAAKAAAKEAAATAQGICPQCGFKAGPGKNFCPECGARMPAPPEPKKCANCGAVVEGKKFCGECGAPVQQEEPSQPAAAQPETVVAQAVANIEEK